MLKRYVVFVLAVCVLGASSAPASASSPGPGWEVFGRFGPTDLPPGGNGTLFLYVYNLGGAESGNSGNPTVTDTLPVGLVAGPGACAGEGTRVVSCEVPAPQAGGRPNLLEIPVTVEANASNGTDPVDGVTVSGGGALGVTKAQVPVKFGAGAAPLGFANFDTWFTNADGTADTQAGSHPYELTVAFAVDSTGRGPGGEQPSGGEVHSLDVDMPPGVVGEPGAVPRCPRALFDGNECPEDSMIGTDYVTVGGFGVAEAGAVYNLVPPPGVAAQFAFSINGISTFLDAGVRSGGDNGITEHIDPVPQQQIDFNTTTIWGVPGEHVTGAGSKPLLTMPTACEGPQQVGIEMLGTWQNPMESKREATVVTHDNEGVPVGFTGCERLVHFQPTISASPDTTFADTPAGLSATVRVAQGVNPEGLATAGLQDTTVTLPEGVVINPGQATGLVACQFSEDGHGLAENGEVNEGPPSCPAASKVGTDEITTPLLPDKLEGSVYILQANPPELKLLVAASGDGINLKLIGTVHLNEATGQLTTTFEDTPQAPFSEFKLSFSGGAQAALVTPTTCGVYRSTAIFTPWSSPFVGDALGASSFGIDSGPGGSPCASPLPFAPSMTAGATTDQAGGYTDFSMLLQRGDGQQRVQSLAFKAPEGLSGMISKVPVCEEPQAALGTCSAASQIGHTVVGAGPGPYPLFIPQAGAPPAPIYLTGPYKGAPFGLSIVVPIVAGPFDLGTEVVRAKIEVDPLTAQITVTTDPLPTIVKGIPADLRSIDAVIDRPDFMFNPTNCDPMSFSGTATSTEGATAALASHFQVGSCRSLTFKPALAVSTSSKSSRVEGTSLAVKLTLPDEGGLSSTANVAKVKVSLPKQLPTPLTTLQKACLEKTFAANPEGCPVASQVGEVEVSTPVLPGRLSGPAYFVSHGGAKYPELIMILKGENGVTVQVHGETFISKAGITTATFAAVPDVPFSSFALTLPKRKYPALTANGNLCKGSLVMPTEMVAQNGLVIKQNTKIAVTGCPKAKKATHKKKKSKAHRKSKGKQQGKKG
jgi:hypothetical protein